MWGEGTNAHGPRMVRRTMDQHILSIEMRAVTKAVDRYLGESMPQTAREPTGGNAHIIMFLARNRGREIYQHTIEQKFCITRSTASRVLALMEKKGLIARESVEHDARCKRIVLTDKADAIVADLKANGGSNGCWSAASPMARRPLCATTSHACVRTSSAHNANLNIKHSLSHLW